MNPYLNPYITNQLAQYNALRLQHAQSQVLPPQIPIKALQSIQPPTPTLNTLQMPSYNPYSLAIATNPALAQAALNASLALNSQHTLALAAQQLQRAHMISTTIATNNLNTEQETAANGMIVHSKDSKNFLTVEHDSFFNMKPLLAENILTSDYFKSLYRCKTYHEVIEEASRYCKNVEPLMIGLSRKPSTAFCILYKFFSMELTVRQIQGLIEYEDNVYVRALGFLYLRYLLPAKHMWQWFVPYLDDMQDFSPKADGKVQTIGDYVKNLLQSQKYFQTLLPRIPVKIERAYKKRLMQRQLIKKRDAENEVFRGRLTVGSKVYAQWKDLKWYTANIDECLQNGCFLVSFVEYEEQAPEEITIGQIKLMGEQRSVSPKSVSVHQRRHSRSHSKHGRSHHHRHHRRSDDRKRSRHHHRHRHRRGHRSHHSSSESVDGHRSRSRSYDVRMDDGQSNDVIHMDDEKEIEEMVRQQARDEVVAVGRDYARRPTAYYHSLTLHLETGTNRKRSPTPPSSVLMRKKRSRQKMEKSGVRDAVVRKIPSKQHLEKMRQLRKRYGDASAGN